MTAASYWSLLAPAIELAEESKIYGENGEYAFAPVGLGFLLGALFVYGADVLITTLGVHSPNVMLGKNKIRHFLMLFKHFTELFFVFFLKLYMQQATEKKEERTINVFLTYQTEIPPQLKVSMSVQTFEEGVSKNAMAFTEIKT